jgi:trehalose 6-phosphate synthase
MSLVLVSNRLPSPAEQRGAQGGLLTAVRSALRDDPFLWVGWSGHNAEEAPPEAALVVRGSARYASFPLSHADATGYYGGYSNRVLWPLFHQRLPLVRYERNDEYAYRRVNELFAQRLVPLLAPDDLLWIHDYHLIPLGAMLRARGVRNRIGFFLHIPFPPRDVLKALPHYRRILEELLSCDLVGFQTANDEALFHEAVRKEFPDRPLSGASTGVFPASIDPDECARAARSGRRGVHGQRLRHSLSGRRLILGVDRLDYSKGLPERFEAYERLLEMSSEWRRSVVYFQIAPLSRSEIPEYAALRTELDDIVGRILGRFADYDWLPVRYMIRGYPRNTVLGFLSLARVGFVTPLCDGMNLVAKEYVAAQPPDDPGVLVLSEFAGAARELEGALVVNPYDRRGVAEALDRALRMPLEERRERNALDRQTIARADARHWARSFLETLGGASPPP